MLITNSLLNKHNNKYHMTNIFESNIFTKSNNPWWTPLLIGPWGRGWQTKPAYSMHNRSRFRGEWTSIPADGKFNRLNPAYVYALNVIEMGTAEENKLLKTDLCSSVLTLWSIDLTVGCDTGMETLDMNWVSRHNHQEYAQ